jgi:UDP-N-acetylglucosamine--N-acetylmuramyl-(pentapeptide) pyrophosphoryl-undecaprenol N-acetylglucosamine transferase
MLFLMAGGGTGGHVLPALAVARELRRRGHEVLFVGTRAGLEAKLVPEAGFTIEFVQIGGLKRVGLAQAPRTLAWLPVRTAQVAVALGRWRPAAVFSLGGYAAGPVVLAAAARRVPMVLMEPNAVPGITNRWMGRIAVRALIQFETAARWFPAGRAELAGVPVREEFFALSPKPREETLNRGCRR